MSELAEYTSAPRCPKCITGFVKWEWQPKHYSKWINAYVQGEYPDVPESILCHCQGCNYKWRMKTADHQKEQP